MKRQSIVRREHRGDQVIRHLECGHEQLETHGGRAPTAEIATCKTCSPNTPPKLPAAPADSTCTAFIVPLKERRIRLCGKPATVLNVRGAPRCGPCSRKPPGSRRFIGGP